MKKKTTKKATSKRLKVVAPPPVEVTVLETPDQKFIQELKCKSREEIFAYFEEQKKEIDLLFGNAQQLAFKYKNAMKEIFGICDGEHVDALQLIKAVHQKGQENAK